MRVAIVTGLCVSFDAISDSVLHQRRALLAAGHDVMVFAQSGSALGPGEVVESADPWLMHCHPDYRAADLVIFHHGIYYELFNALLLSHDHAVRVVHFHNVTPPEFLVGAGRRAARAGLDQLSIAANAHGAWCDSKHNADVLLSLADMDRRDVHVVPLCVPGSDHLGPPRQGRAGVLTVGRLVAAKGLDVLIRAYAALADEQRVAHSLRIIGRRADAEATFPDFLATLADGLGVAETVSIETDLDETQRDLAYQEALVYASASRHEGFGVPVIEALSCGCRVVVTDAGALPDTVAGFGEVVPVDDVDALTESIAKALADGRSEMDGDALDSRLRTFSRGSSYRRTVFEAESAARRGTGRTMAEMKIDRERFAPKQARLVQRLACPSCRSPLDVADQVEVAGAVAFAELQCPDHGLVGVIEDFRPGFLDRNLERHTSIRDGEAQQVVDLTDDVTRIGAWSEVSEGLLSEGSPEESLTFDCSPGGFEVRLFGHDWSGVAQIEVEGGRSFTVDLYRTVPEEIRVESGPLGAGSHRVSVLTTGRCAPASQGTQVIVAGIRRSVPVSEMRVPGLGSVNRGNPYPSRFPELVAGLEQDAMVLDCGGGDRRFGDDRVYNLEYMDYELPDVYGDGLVLPFADDTFDLVQSQAVLEHVPDPQRAVDEIVRILKPGGLAYFEIAFMQPLHAVPSHYMNVTPHGVEHLCRGLDVLESGEFGGLAETISWIGGLVGAEGKVGAQRFRDVVATLEELDAQLSSDELRMAASAVYLLGRKPAAGQN